MTYAELKTERQKRYDALFEKVGLFWAFGNEQFKEAMEKHPVDDGFKYVSIGMGGYFPGQNKQAYVDGMSELNAWEKQAKKELKENEAATESAILYELNNHECFYSCDLTEVIELFDGIYTPEQIRRVYKKHTNSRLQLEKGQEATL